MQKKTTLNNSIITSAITIGMLLAFTGPVSADDCAAYNTCPTPPQTIEFSLTKQVKKANDTNYTSEINVKPGDKVNFIIRATNVGQVKTDAMRIIDYLPAEFTNVQGNLVIDFNNFKVGDTVTMEITADVKNDISKSICLVNNAELQHNAKPTNSASAKVCVEKGQVLAAQQLPATASINLGSIVIAASAIATGIYISRKAI